MIKNTKIATLIVPILMVLFLVRNVIMVETDHMDSWMGGGMRMFGKVDKMLYRVAGMTVTYNNKEYFVNFRNFSDLEDQDVALRILPNDNRLETVLGKVKKMKWCYDDTTDLILIADKSCSDLIEPFDIKSVGVYRTHFEDSNNEVSLKLINSFNNE